MITRNFVLFCFVLGSVALFLCDNASAASKGATVPGVYHNWNGDIDEVTIVQSFRLDTYNDIAVESFDVTKVTLPDSNENTYGAVRSALNTIKPAFLEGFQENLRRKTRGPNPSRGKGQTLVVLAHLTKLDPGSRAARYWGSFGAGAVKIEMTGEIVDAPSRKILVRFKQERRSGFGLFGGGYGELFTRTARQIGGDIADLLNAF
jgi:Domain of unknown function (DUF4410)